MPKGNLFRSLTNRKAEAGTALMPNFIKLICYTPERFLGVSTDLGCCGAPSAEFIFHGSVKGRGESIMGSQPEKDDQTRESDSLSEKEKEQIRVLEILKLETLRQVDLFSKFPETALRNLANNCKDRFVKKDEVLCSEGAMQSVMYVILTGEFEVSKMKKRVDIALPGQYLGEMTLIDHKPRSATVKALMDSLVMEINEEVFANQIIHDPENFYSIIRTLASRTRNLLNVISQDCQTLNCFIHDMRNVLSALDLPQLYLNSFIKKLEKSEEKEDLKAIDKSLKKIASVRNSLMTLMEQSLMVTKKGKSEYVKTRGALLPLAEEIVEELAGHKSLKGKTMKVTSTGDVGELEFNALDIKRVVQNLVINAGYASEQNGTVEIIFQGNGKNTQISVVDQGCGIPDDVKPHLLKTQYTTKDDGNGFGLLSCREIVEDRHQGKFWFDSEAGKGTAFHFTLPN